MQICSKSFQSLTIENCGLQEVERSAFRGSPYLTEVSFKDNDLISIPYEAFQYDADNYIPLTVLQLSDNHIRSFDDDDFTGIRGNRSF